MRKRIRLQAGPLARFRYAATSTASKVLALLGVLAAAGILVWGAIPNIPYVYHAAAAFIDHHGNIIRDDLSVAKEPTNAPETATLLASRFAGRIYLTETRACVDIGNISKSQRQEYDVAATNFENSLNAFIPDEAAVDRDFDEVQDAWKAVRKKIEATGQVLPEECAAV